MSDKQEKASDEIDRALFTFKVTKEGTIFISRYGQRVGICKGVEAVKLKAKLEMASDSQRQLLLAKITGNYKRGNERAGKNKVKA